MFGPKSPAYSIGNSKREISLEQSAPGPASYNIPRDPLPRSVSFNKARKNSRLVQDIPGPGSYTMNSYIGKAPHAIIISRKKSKFNEKCPGPADYTPNESAHSIKYTMRSKSNSKIININPGPGSYNSQNILKNSPKATIGKASRIIENNLITPGPGSYDPIHIKKSVPKFSFSLTPRGENNYEKLPGPGAYDLDFSANSGKPAVITPRRPETARDKIPGPGSYNIDIDQFSVPKWTISKAKKNKKKFLKYCLRLLIILLIVY